MIDENESCVKGCTLDKVPLESKILFRRNVTQHYAIWIAYYLHRAKLRRRNRIYSNPKYCRGGQDRKVLLTSSSLRSNTFSSWIFYYYWRCLITCDLQLQLAHVELWASVGLRDVKDSPKWLNGRPLKWTKCPFPPHNFRISQAVYWRLVVKQPRHQLDSLRHRRGFSKRWIPLLRHVIFLEGAGTKNLKTIRRAPSSDMTRLKNPINGLEICKRHRSWTLMPLVGRAVTG